MEKVYFTDRLILKTFGTSSNETRLVVDYFRTNKEHLQPWDPYRNDQFYTNESRRASLKWEQEEMVKGSYLRLWIFKREDVEFRKIIGTIGVSNIKRGEIQSCRIGYSIDKHETCLGYVTEAMCKVIDMLFNELKLRRVEATVMPSNKASLRVLGKLNFEHEGLCEKHQQINGRWEDHILLALLNKNIE